MTKLLQRVEVTLRSFYIFNSSFGQKEGEEHKKILYYHPNDIELNTKIKDVGLSEAIITFTGTFTADDDCKGLHTQKTTQLFYQPEPGYWMVLVLNVPKETRLKDGVEVTEYRGGDVSDRIYSAVLRQCYHMFRLFGGTFRQDKELAVEKLEAARLQLCERLQLFYDKYLLALKLSNCDIMDMMRSIQYLALDKALFLRAHNFNNMIRATFTPIEESLLLYNDQVVCSGKLNAEDLHSLHEYIVCNVLDKARHSELSGGLILTRSNNVNTNLYQNGAFITGPETPEDQSSAATPEVISSTKPPKVHLSLDVTGEIRSYYLIIYRALNATLCLLVDAKSQLNDDFYGELHVYMGPQLTSLARDIGEELSKQQISSIGTTYEGGVAVDAATNMSPKYLFINEQSLKHHTNIFMDQNRRVHTSANSIPRNVINLIADLAHSDTVGSNGNSTTTEELQVKTTNDFWIVKRRCNWRQYYVILLNSKATLLDVTQEAKRIFEQELTDDVFFDK